MTGFCFPDIIDCDILLLLSKKENKDKSDKG